MLGVAYVGPIDRCCFGWQGAGRVLAGCWQHLMVGDPYAVSGQGSCDLLGLGEDG